MNGMNSRSLFKIMAICSIAAMTGYFFFTTESNLLFYTTFDTNKEILSPRVGPNSANASNFELVNGNLINVAVFLDNRLTARLTNVSNPNWKLFEFIKQEKTLGFSDTPENDFSNRTDVYLDEFKI